MNNKIKIDYANKNTILNIALLVADATGKSETSVKLEVTKNSVLSKCFQ